MTQQNNAETASKVYALLSPLKPQERQRIIQAALILLEDGPLEFMSNNSASNSNANENRSEVKTFTASTTKKTALNEQEFFDQKQPKFKIEELAIAARYRELFLSENTHTKEDLEAITKNARLSFDSKNFARDLENAKKKGFFTRDPNITLSSGGQKFVDALPDRESLKSIKVKRPKAGRKKKKKSSGKKAA